MNALLFVRSRHFLIFFLALFFAFWWTGNICGLLVLIPVLIGTQYMRRASTQK